jgi:hypothetical protein
MAILRVAWQCYITRQFDIECKIAKPLGNLAIGNLTLSLYNIYIYIKVAKIAKGLARARARKN